MKSRIGYAWVIPTLLALMPVPLQATVELEWFGLDEPPSTSIFRSTGPSELPGSTALAATAEWPVEVNMALLEALPEWIDLNLPDQSMTTLVRDRGELRGPGAFVWSGHSEECSAIFTAYSSPIGSWARSRA
jgi:hypothetical protein